MSTLTQVRAAIKATLDAVGLRTYTTLLNDPQPPCVIIKPVSAEFDGAMGRGQDKYFFDLHVYVASPSERAGPNSLDEYLSGFGAKSIRQAIYNDPTLGTGPSHSPADAATTMTGFVSGWDSYGADIESGGAYWHGVVHLQVLTKGNS